LLYQLSYSGIIILQPLSGISGHNLFQDAARRAAEWVYNGNPLRVQDPFYITKC
jgi:hypothetical protein